MFKAKDQCSVENTINGNENVIGSNNIIADEYHSSTVITNNFSSNDFFYKKFYDVCGIILKFKSEIKMESSPGTNVKIKEQKINGQKNNDGHTYHCYSDIVDLNVLQIGIDYKLIDCYYLVTMHFKVNPREQSLIKFSDDLINNIINNKVGYSLYNENFWYIYNITNYSLLDRDYIYYATNEYIKHYINICKKYEYTNVISNLHTAEKCGFHITCDNSQIIKLKQFIDFLYKIKFTDNNNYNNLYKSSNLKETTICIGIDELFFNYLHDKYHIKYNILDLNG